MKRFFATGIAGGILGAIVFWYYQMKLQGATISGFIGEQVVRQGGYSLPPELVGWGVHLWVSLSYAFLLALILMVIFPASFALNRGVGLAAALFLGWITTLIAAPAIQITIGLLVGKGFPAKLWSLNPAKGHPFWNHLLFFILVWAADTAFALLFGKEGGGQGLGAAMTDNSGRDAGS
ncbi:hypothetical protein ACFLQ0_04610 [Nitrospinota bacterium]